MINLYNGEGLLALTAFEFMASGAVVREPVMKPHIMVRSKWRCTTLHLIGGDKREGRILEWYSSFQEHIHDWKPPTRSYLLHFCIFPIVACSSRALSC